ncbi:MAG: folate-binding protein [Burkholderia sp.]|nr:folate-binding protein [Burkholderia sp.]
MRLDQFGVIDVSGVDAITFLHSQFTNDIKHLDPCRALFTGYCSPKGRLLASFIVWRIGQTIRLLVSKDIQDIIQKQLSMFILRSQIKLLNVNDSLEVVGFTGNVYDVLLQIFSSIPCHVYEKVDGPAGSLIRLPNAADRERYLWINTRVLVDEFIDKLGDTLPIVSRYVWDWLSIRAGEPRITKQTIGQFIPQMVNFDIIGAISFQKGCYPGQEVISRIQYRGTIKRRTVLSHIEDTEHTTISSINCENELSGVELFHSDDPDQPCGMVVNAVALPSKSIDALVEIKLTALFRGTIHIGSASGPTLSFKKLPYTFQ